MKILKIIGIAIITVVVLLLIAALIAPNNFKVARKIVINAPVSTIFNQVNSFQNWEPWSPWLQRDSTITNIYTGPASGVGNKVTWTSKNSGEGSMEIIESRPNQYIRNELALGNFSQFESHFTFTEVAEGIEVTWADSGGMSFPWNIFTPFADKMMGPDFEAGLANLKDYVESKPQWRLGDFKIEETGALTVLSILDSCPATGIGDKLGELYGAISAVMQKNKLDFAGPAMAFYHSYADDKVVLEAAVPVSKEIMGEGRVKGKTIPPTKVLAVSFFGNYHDMSLAMPTITEYMQSNGLKWNGPEFEIYITDPTTVKDALEIETRINFPIE